LSQVVPTIVGSPAAKPGLIFFHSSVSGHCRRVEGYIAQVLQRRRNHDTFRLYSVARERRPDLIEKFAIAQLPTLVVLEGKRVTARLDGATGCRQIESFLSPWLTRSHPTPTRDDAGRFAPA
jgi:thioredoxin-like negative regulator of GroEL